MAFREKHGWPECSPLELTLLSDISLQGKPLGRVAVNNATNATVRVGLRYGRIPTAYGGSKYEAGVDLLLNSHSRAEVSIPQVSYEVFIMKLGSSLQSPVLSGGTVRVTSGSLLLTISEGSGGNLQLNPR